MTAWCAHSPFIPTASSRRIQQAMDHCAAGQAVELAADGANQVFLSGPLNLRSGGTLLIDANTVLAASTNPRLYDITPGSCGVLGEHADGCKPLLSGTDVDHSGITGAGAIDGRCGDRMLGKSTTWWQLAHQAKVLDRNQKVPGLLVLSHVRDFTLYGITLRDSPHNILSSQPPGRAWPGVSWPRACRRMHCPTTPDRCPRRWQTHMPDRMRP